MFLYLLAYVHIFGFSKQLGILRKLPRTISRESANISINETLINLSQQNRAKNVGGKRGIGKKIPSGTVVNLKNTSGGVAARSIAAMQQFDRIIE